MQHLFPPTRMFGLMLAGLRRPSLRMAFALCLLGGLMPLPAAAQYCQPATGAINFGTVSPDALTDSQNNLAYTCQSNATATYFRICVYIAEGEPLGGVSPRRMTNYNGAELKYDFYSDAARTQVIGPPPTGGGFPTYSFTTMIPGGYVQVQNTFPLYARVPAGQTNLPAGNTFQSQVNGSVFRYSWANGTYPANCNTGTGTGAPTFYSSVTATVSNSCRITLATDLDFGAVGSLAANRDQASSILVRCPVGTTWRLGLSDGINASGTVRRMRSPAGNFVTYELYRDAGRTQRWGNTLGTDTTNGTGMGEATAVTQSVYGRVPAQTSRPSGTYTDTITVTLTY